MGSGGKGGGKGSSSYDYYGTVAGAICWGVAHTLQALLVDGKQIVTGPVTLSTEATDLTLDPGADDYLDDGGRITVYRGDQTSSDAALTDHPPYTGLCYVVAKGLLFGRERTQAPNIQAIISRLPVADTSLVPALENIFTALDGDSKPTTASQVNPVAALADLLTSRHGLGLPLASLDAASWATASAWVHHTDRRAYTFCSPAWTSQEEARQAIRSILEMIDATLYWTASGTIALALLKPGVTPADPLTLDARHITQRHRLEAPGLADVPTTTLVKYADRDREWKRREQQAVNLVALGLRSGVAQVQSIDRPHITGADQAAAHAVEMSLRASRPIGSVEITVRRPIVSALYPGAKVLVDIDPEPGGSGLAQLCVVEAMEEGDGGPVRMDLRPDTKVAAAAYSPAWTAETPQDNSCPAIDDAKALAIPLPPAVWPTPSIAIMATRPRVDVVGFRVYYSPDDVDYADLGSQPGFSARVALDGAIETDDVEAILTLTDGDSGPDAYLSGRYPTTEAGTQADELLLVLANVSAGEVVITDGSPEIEICSIQTRALVGSDMTYTIARGRLGTLPREWDDGAVGWILPFSSLVAWQHPGISASIEDGSTGYLHLVAYTAQDTDDTTPIPEITVTMPSDADPAPVVTWTTPSTSGGTTDGAGVFAPDFEVLDRQGDLVDVKLVSEAPSGNSVLWGHWTLSLRRTWEYPGDNMTLESVGIHRVTVIATDRRGTVTSSVRTVERLAGSGGDAIPAPRFDPPSGHRFYNQDGVNISRSSPADRIEWQLSPLGSDSHQVIGGGDPLPSGWTRIDTTTANPLSQVLRSSARIWARAGDGTNWSGWVFADYERTQ